MKKLLLVITIFALQISSTTAQIDEKEIIPKNYIGINLSGSYSKLTIKTNTRTQLNVSTSPFYGRRIKKFVFGTGLSFGYIFDKIPTGYKTGNMEYFDKDQIFVLSIAPTIRYYSKYNLLLSASFIAGMGKGETITQYINYSNFNKLAISHINKDYTANIIGWEIGIGYAFKAGKSLLIEPLISYQKTTIDAFYNYSPSVSQTSTQQGSYYYPNFFKDYRESRDYSLFSFGIGTTFRF